MKNWEPLVSGAGVGHGEHAGLLEGLGRGLRQLVLELVARAPGAERAPLRRGGRPDLGARVSGSPPWIMKPGMTRWKRVPS